MIVVDTSAVLAALAARPADPALLAALAARPADPALLARLGEDGDLHALHLIDVEVQHALRRLVGTRSLTEQRASEVRADLADLVIVRYPHQPLADRIWELRRNLTAYDAAFVALGEALGVPLVTCDARLASPTHRAVVEVFRPR